MVWGWLWRVSMNTRDQSSHPLIHPSIHLYRRAKRSPEEPPSHHQPIPTHLSPRPGPVRFPCASTVATTRDGSAPMFSTTSTPSSLPPPPDAAAEAAGRFLLLPFLLLLASPSAPGGGEMEAVSQSRGG